MATNYEGAYGERRDVLAACGVLLTAIKSRMALVVGLPIAAE